MQRSDQRPISDHADAAACICTVVACDQLIHRPAPGRWRSWRRALPSARARMAASFAARSCRTHSGARTSTIKTIFVMSSFMTALCVASRYPARLRSTGDLDGWHGRVDFCLSCFEGKAAKADIRFTGLRPNSGIFYRPGHTAEKSSSATFRRCMSARDSTSRRSSFSRAARRSASSFCSLINPLVDASHAAAAEFASFPVAFIICSNLSCSAYVCQRSRLTVQQNKQCCPRNQNEYAVQNYGT